MTGPALAELSEAGRNFYGVALVPLVGALVVLLARLGPRAIAATFALATAITKASASLGETALAAREGLAVGTRVEASVLEGRAELATLAARLEAGQDRLEAAVLELRLAQVRAEERERV